MTTTSKDQRMQFLFRCLCIVILTVVLFLTTEPGFVHTVDCPHYMCIDRHSQYPVNPVVRTLIKWEYYLHNTRHALFGTPELSTALFWVQRTHLVAFRDWFNPNAGTLTPLPGAAALPSDTQSSGRIVYPLHAVYLYGIGAIVRGDAARLVENFTWAAFPEEALMVRSNMVFYSAVLMYVAITLLGLPVLWRLGRLIAGLLVGALAGREQCESTPSAPTALVVSKMSEEDKAAVCRRLTFVAAFAGFCCGLLPAFVIDAACVTPSTLAVILLMWAFYFLVQDELTMNPEREFALDDFAMETPVLEQGRLRFYALKKSMSRRPLLLAAMCGAVACMLQSSFISLAPLLLLWAATSCYQHGFQRVAVMQADADGKAAATAGGVRHESPMGFSCYRDRLKINEWFAYMSGTVMAVVLVCMTPFCYGKMNFLQFIDLFARPSDEHVPARLSVSGANEMKPECLIEPMQFFRCTRALPNVWRALEAAGAPLTRTFTTIATPFAKRKTSPTHSERQLWLDYASIVLLVLVHSVSILVLLLYRTRKPPLKFDAPSAYQAMHVEQQKEYEDYIKQATLKRGQPKDAARKDREAEKKTPQRPSKTVTCISREEYVLKQLSMLSWMALISSASTTLLLSSPAYMHYVPLLGVVAVLAMLHCEVSCLRRVSPTVFQLAWEQPIPTPVAGAAATPAAPAQPAAPVVVNEALESVPLTTQWCATSPAAISEKADFTWVLAAVLAVVKSSECLTFEWFPYHEQAVWILTAALVLQMVASRFWVRVDVVTTWLIVAFQFGAIALMFYAAHDYAAAAKSLPESATTTDRIVKCLSTFLPFAASRVVPLYPFKEAAPYMTGVAHLNYECTVAAVLLIGAIVHALFRLVRLGLGPEELRFVAIEREMDVLRSKKNN